jgi:hypothetical protein
MDSNVWRVTFKNNPADEEEYPGGGWCGYLAIDQIIRKAAFPSRYRELEGAKSLIGSLKELVRSGVGSFRKNWRTLKKGVLRSPKETVLSVIETLEQASSFIPAPPLKVERWIPLAILQGMCSKHKFSIWKEDPDDSEFNTLVEGPISSGSVTNSKEWIEICQGQIMANRSHHYYVRSSNWGHDLAMGFEKAIDRLRMLMGLPEELACEVGIIGSPIFGELDNSPVAGPEEGMTEVEPSEGLMDPPIVATVETSTAQETGDGNAQPNESVEEVVNPSTCLKSTEINGNSKLFFGMPTLGRARTAKS